MLNLLAKRSKRKRRKRERGLDEETRDRILDILFHSLTDEVVTELKLLVGSLPERNFVLEISVEDQGGEEVLALSWFSSH